MLKMLDEASKSSFGTVCQRDVINMDSKHLIVVSQNVINLTGENEANRA